MPSCIQGLVTSFCASVVSDADIATPEPRVVNPDSPGYPSEALHAYRLNADVEEHSERMLNQLPQRRVDTIDLCMTFR